MSAKREFKESRMQTARARVSRGRLARVRRAWTSGTDGDIRDVDDGMRFVRCIAGPTSLGLRISPEVKNEDCWCVLLFECEEGGGVGRFESGI